MTMNNTSSGSPVEQFFEVRGDGDPLVALHPGGVDALAFGPNMDAWSKKFRVYTSERRRHGHTPDVKGPLTFADMANDTVAFIENIVGAPTMFAELGKHPGDTVTVHLTERHPHK